jgi:DNA-binding transcriptional MerR regulator
LKETLSPNGDPLADAFFESIGEAKPAKIRRERAVEIINGLKAEGFAEEAIREACRLAGERGARGPDLLPHVIGEAHERVEAQRQAEATATARRQADERQQERARTEFESELAAVENLDAETRARLEAECRASLPAGASEGMIAAVLPGMIAARLRQGAAA